jgi:hypothetical protein
MFVVNVNNRKVACIEVPDQCTSEHWKSNGSDYTEARCGVCGLNAVGAGFSDRFLSVTGFLSKDDELGKTFAFCDKCGDTIRHDLLDVVICGNKIYMVDHCERENN